MEFDFVKFQEEQSRRAASEARERLAELLRSSRDVLVALDYPGTVSIDATRETVKRSLSPFARQSYRTISAPLGERRVWSVPVERAEVTYPPRYVTCYVGIDGTCYLGGVESDAPADLCDRMVRFLERLLRLHAPGQAPTVEISFLDATFVAAPRPRWETSEQHETYLAELRCEDPAEAPGAADADDGVGAVPTGRLDQLRYLFLAWLDVVTADGAPAEHSRPDLFLKPAPMLPGGATTSAELVALAESLLAAKQIEWIEDLHTWARFSEHPTGAMPLWPSATQLTSRMFGGVFVDQTPWRLVPTADGRRVLRHHQAAMSTTQRTESVRRTLLRWIGQHAKDPYTVALPMFLASADALVEGAAVSAPDVYRAARWLGTRGYIRMPANAHPGISVEVGLTRQGLSCLEQYGGDPRAMGHAERGGGDQSVTIRATSIGNVNVGSTITHQIGQQTEPRGGISAESRAEGPAEAGG